MNPFIRKLQNGAEIPEEDIALLESIAARTRRVEAHEDVIREGEAPCDVHLVMEGFAARYKVLENGQRHIMAYLVPGDFCDLHVALLGQMDHGIATLTRSTMVEIERSVIEDLTTNHPEITRAMWWATLVDEATLREWLVNLGQRSAEERIAHLFCELFVRLSAVGRTPDHIFSFPLSQEELADSVGLSVVHTNRTLRSLRSQGLADASKRMVKILDFDGLKKLGGFDPKYLHLKRSGLEDAG